MKIKRKLQEQNISLQNIKARKIKEYLSAKFLYCLIFFDYDLGEINNKETAK